MSFHPTTQRLVLRTPVMADVADMVAILNDYEVVKNLAPVPHPFTEDACRERIVVSAAERAAGNGYWFAVTRAMDGAFLGLCAVDKLAGGVWEFGYWYGRTFWGQGYATEAAQPVLRFAFADLGAEMLTAGWFVDNPASGRVLEKLGFTPTGVVQRNALARGHAVASNRVQLTAAQFARKKAA
ncbi:MAG TPA: GNAT family N-acetyltransferase [Rhizomicrobium sp.]|jgi:RimJ/RimL family protein N-acetyltransferase|nr:GNAT family N-acetyltransferase [Rhizomicrobium sp.]